MRCGAVFITSLVLAHHAVAMACRGARSDLALPLVAWQNAFVTTVVIVLPLVAAGLVWTVYRRIGLYALAISMLAAFVFAIMQHYLLISPNHIVYWPAAGSDASVTLQWTTAATTLVEGVAAMTAAYFIGRERAAQLSWDTR